MKMKKLLALLLSVLMLVGLRPVTALAAPDSYSFKLISNDEEADAIFSYGYWDNNDFPDELLLI